MARVGSIVGQEQEEVLAPHRHAVAASQGQGGVGEEVGGVVEVGVGECRLMIGGVH